MEIGRGGFGVVYRAREPDLDRTVAVKVLTSAASDGAARSRFDRERRSMGVLTGHPGIVTVFASGYTTGGAPYIVMAHMPGGSLADRLRREGPLPWSEAFQLGATLADALEAAHRAGVLHRDIKPENVMVSGYGQAQLGDFGIARIAGAEPTRSGSVTLSVAYAAPELLAGQPATVRSDVYALAATLVTLVLGHPAFARDTDESVVPLMARIATEPVPDLRHRGVPDAVCRVLEQAMAKDPSVRQASAAELGRQLRAALRSPPTDPTVLVPPPPGPPPVAPPPAPPPVTPGPSRRRSPVWLGLLVALALLAVAGAAAILAAGSGEGGSEDDARPGATSATEQASQPSSTTTTTEASTTTSTTAAAPTGPVVPLRPAALTATSTAPAGVEASGAPVTYEAANTVDGDPGTAWRTPGGGVGERLTLRLTGPATVTSVGLLPGYAKIDPGDGTDRFPQNRVIRSVRWSFDDGSAVIQRFQPVATVQSVAVSDRTRRVVVEVLETSPPGERDFTAISEIELAGVQR